MRQSFEEVGHMATQNERVFFEDAVDGGRVIVTQYRLVTHTGATYPTDTIQSVYRTRETVGGGLSPFHWWGGCGCAGFFPLGIALALLGVGSCVNPWFARTPLGPSWPVLLPLGIVLMVGILLLYRRHLRKNPQRNQYWAHFMLAGGGSFSGITSSRGNTATDLTRTQRRPDYSVWSYDEEWIATLVHATNEAMIAARSR